MAVQIAHIRLSTGGSGHEHITDYRWRSLADKEVASSNKPTMVDWIDNKGGVAYVGPGVSRADVGPVHPTNGQPSLRTHADGIWSNTCFLCLDSEHISLVLSISAEHQRRKMSLRVKEGLCLSLNQPV